MKRDKKFIVSEECCFHELNSPFTACAPNLHIINTWSPWWNICKFVTQAPRECKNCSIIFYTLNMEHRMKFFCLEDTQEFP